MKPNEFIYVYIHALHVVSITVCILFSGFLFLNKNILSYLLLSELLWVLLYMFCVVAGLYVDSPILLSFSLTSLVLAGLELGIGVLFFYFF